MEMVVGGGGEIAGTIVKNDLRVKSFIVVDSLKPVESVSRQGML